MNQLDVIAQLARGPLITDVPALSATKLTSCLRTFVERDLAYRRQFLQTEYGYAFDGYSHHGQVDSTHQAPDDLLHSFVFSDFYPASRYPQEFQAYLEREWPLLGQTLREVESSILSQLPAAIIAGQYHDHIGHMLTANYYPPQQEFEQPAAGNTRLSEHPDVSLLTVFPFGIDQYFEYQDACGQWHTIPESDKIVMFPGFLLQWLSNGVISALNHRVVMSDDVGRARFSFATFSLPYPGTTLRRECPGQPGQTEAISASDYFRSYLALWDY